MSKISTCKLFVKMIDPFLTYFSVVEIYFRRLRDKLIGDERLPLAMEVSTKCGLDPTGVWVAWGMMCLQSGDFPGAREKFSKCLKVCSFCFTEQHGLQKYS